MTVLSAHRWATNGEMIAGAASLGYIPRNGIVVDTTYGMGSFWTEFRPDNLIEHDLYVGDGVTYHALPEPDNFADSVVFDPSYITSRDTSNEGVRERFKDLYGIGNGPSGASNRHELVDDIFSGLAECFRITKPRGFVLVKCQPFQNGKRDFVYMPGNVFSEATRLGYRMEDELIFLRSPGPSSTDTFNGARNTHSVLMVFCKRSPIRRRS